MNLAFKKPNIVKGMEMHGALMEMTNFDKFFKLLDKFHTGDTGG